MSRKTHVSTRINGESVEFLTEAHESLLDVLRNELMLTGTKEGCTAIEKHVKPNGDSTGCGQMRRFFPAIAFSLKHESGAGLKCWRW